MQKVIGLQYLRGIASIGVVLSHATGRFGEPWLKGTAGVDLFFLISGFMMIFITNNQTRPMIFVLDRLFRIAPLYWLVTTVMVVGAVSGLFPRIALTADYVVKSYLFLPAKAPMSNDVLPLASHGWTINYEMMFYSIFSILIFAPVRLRALLFTVVSLFLVGLGAMLEPSNAMIRNWTQPIILEFAVGACIGHIWKQRWLETERIGTVTLVFGIVLFTALPASESSVRLVFFGVPALLVLIGVLLMESEILACANCKVFVLIGDASYSIYIWHGLVISLTVALTRLLELSSSVGLILSTNMCILFGVLAHLWLEKPIYAFIRSRRRATIPVNLA